MRSFTKTVENIKKNLISSEHEYTILYCCWTTENTEDFEREFPNAFVKKIEQPTINGLEFQEWYKNMMPAIRYNTAVTYNNIIISNESSINKFMNKYFEPMNDLYRYYLQIYGYKELVKFIDSKNFLNKYDIFIRLRCDCIYNQIIYNEFENIEENILYCVKENSYKQFIEHESLNDQLFFGSRRIMMIILNILDYCDKLKINGTDIWYNRWEDVIHPETTLYKALTYNGFEEKYVERLNVEIIR
jgi:hypothetical protein